MPCETKMLLPVANDAGRYGAFADAPAPPQQLLMVKVNAGPLNTGGLAGAGGSGGASGGGGGGGAVTTCGAGGGGD